MPLKKGTSKRTVSENFHEFRHGERYAKVERKYGKAKANAVMDAAVLSTKRKSARSKDRRK